MNLATTSDNYFIHNNRRYVVPFDHEHRRNVRAPWVGKTVLHVFDQLFPYQTKDFHQQQIARHRLLSYDKHNRPNASDHLLRLGDVVSHTSHTHEPSIREPPLHLLGQTDQVVAVCKSSSVPVHACGRYRRNTVQGVLEFSFGISGLRTVHRLDRVTSGVVLLAKTKQSARVLSEQIKAGVLRKEYLAKVVGLFPLCLAPEKSATTTTRTAHVWEDDYLVCNAPLAHHPTTKKVHVPLPSDRVHAQQARTAFRRLASLKIGNDVVSLVHCVPTTGRTHQIRVHLQHLGFPIVDDPLYGVGLETNDATEENRANGDDQQKDEECNGVGLETNDATEDRANGDNQQNIEVQGECNVAWKTDALCPHCPHVEPLSSEGSGGARDPRKRRVGSQQQHSDGICLHAMCYYCLGGTMAKTTQAKGHETSDNDSGRDSGAWSWSCPLELTPEWATSLLGQQAVEIWSHIENARGTCL
jgi:tRNA pseudouridine synthase 9